MSERRVILRHSLRASLTPVVTQFGLDVGTLIGGAIITEQVFSLPGLGWTAVHAIQSQDLPLIMGIVIIASTGVIVANLIVDIFYAVLDPLLRGARSSRPAALADPGPSLRPRKRPRKRRAVTWALARYVGVPTGL